MTGPRYSLDLSHATVDRDFAACHEAGIIGREKEYRGCDFLGQSEPALRNLAKEGAYVFITGRRQKEFDEAVKAIGSNVTGIQGDIAKLADLDRLYEIVATKGRIDVVFANAGVAEFAPLGEITEEHFDKLFDINVKGTLFTVQKALSLLNDGGSIILNGSVASVKGTHAFSVYGATKAALRSFVRTWTSDLKDRHIRSNVISPGPTDTPVIDG
jgi:NAD(P)-dependent dehydrogenase (short-subunit alcohol dehydrogenase family)